MAVDDTFKALIDEKLIAFDGLTSKRMFGGVGYFRDGVMFGAIMNNIFRLRADEITKGDFEAYGCGPHTMPGKKGSMPYFQVPEEVLMDPEKLAKWAEKAYETALRNKKK